jgi:DNA repair photolyase
MPNSIIAKSILNKAKRRGRDSWFLDDYTINAYSGCSFNCLYCYIRGSKYGEHMEEKASMKSNAVELLDKQLAARAKKKEYGFIVMSSATDPYLHFEEKEKLTRRMLEVILKHRFPVHVITKSELVTRDFDLFHEINKNAILPPDLEQHMKDRVIVTFSFSTVDDNTGHIFEPGAPAPSLRLKTMQSTSENGFLTGVSMMPLIPYISDTKESLANMFNAFKAHGAKYIMPSTITLFGEGKGDSKTLVKRAVGKHFPHLLPKYEKFFGSSTGVPPYYFQAFNQKMREMSQAYNISLRIVSF